MQSIGVRELRQNASAYLRRVAAGETFTVTERGRPVAILAANRDAVEARAAELVEWLVEVGAYGSVDEALADGVTSLAERARQRVIGEAIVAGYTRTPQSDDEVVFARAAGLRSIAAEPW